MCVCRGCGSTVVSSPLVQEEICNRVHTAAEEVIDGNISLEVQTCSFHLVSLLFMCFETVIQLMDIALYLL